MSHIDGFQRYSTFPCETGSARATRSLKCGKDSSQINGFHRYVTFRRLRRPKLAQASPGYRVRRTDLGPSGNFATACDVPISVHTPPSETDIRRR
jgi:hypothetical protein